MEHPLLVILTGPSGAGKDTILAALKARDNPAYAFPPNATNRAPRPGEVDGVDYIFVSDEEFARMVREGELLEHASVYGQAKGVPRGAIREALDGGRTVILRTDVQGARYIKSIAAGCLTIFIAPPSLDELRRRMKERGGDSDDQVAIRLKTAEAEMREAHLFDELVVNDELERCVAEIDEIIARQRKRAGREALRL